MILYTKSIQEPALEKDGIRICVMRRIRPEYQFDIWIPKLAPPDELLQKSLEKRISDEEYIASYQKILDSEKLYVKILIELALKHDVTILCWEKTPDRCHRRLLAEECKRQSPDLKVVMDDLSRKA